MSNKIRHIAKGIEKELPFDLSLVGSIIAATAMISGKTYEDAEEFYKSIKNKVKCETVMEYTNFVWNNFGRSSNKQLRSHLGLFYDERDILTPMVAVCDKDGFPLPNNPSGKPYGIIGHFLDGRDYVQMEWLYDEDGNEYAEEGEDYEEID